MYFRQIDGFPALHFAIFGSAAHRKHALTKRAGAAPWANPNVVFAIYPRRIQSLDTFMFPVDFRSDFIFVSYVFQVLGHVLAAAASSCSSSSVFLVWSNYLVLILPFPFGCSFVVELVSGLVSY